MSGTRLPNIHTHRAVADGLLKKCLPHGLFDGRLSITLVTTKEITEQEGKKKREAGKDEGFRPHLSD